MNIKKLSGIVSLFFITIGYAQKSDSKFVVQPYLQNASPSAITIMWETSSGEESTVEWGKTQKLGKKSSGSAFDINFSESRVHEVTLEGLERFTVYYYRVKTGNLRSDIYQFKTPPFAEDEESFNMIAMSDMQIDSQHPEKFGEILQQGILSYLEKEFGGALPDNLALVMIPGDLVSSGSNYDHWNGHFFKPSHPLFSQVPVYPVLGNHERNTQFYFKYFSLPKNGTPAYAEHWWYKDYGNTRIIGLDSNDGYRDLRQQLEWLKDVLAKTEKDPKIDFVFAQLHHPYKSELWIPGEEDFTGKLVDLLEDFTNKTNKPSIHFFGHTHGYSRGQSKDHKHLWVNVASAGGAIDNWGEFEGKDYDEFTVTQDEYGFVMVEVSGDRSNPKFTLKRISRGNNINPKNNEITDSITIWKNNSIPDAPIPIEPVKNQEIKFNNIVLKAGHFKGNMADAFHAASNWQISSTKDFSKPIYDSWKQFENWYYMENRQKNDDLSDEKTANLEPNKTYYWRVRYRDQYLNWSDWSTISSFKTLSK
ncbi:fibronectin type III domain-containing protein [Pareuzebyella sediminis]|uniref:fibronectin type III domain-containing protein n=1 Tax=Pareuzebyella sediminis TaxID=2607998 RepID=UPI0011EE8DF0|nr:fibronectin type III domain-containing protein [Pareuzebyella sediminis]